MVACNRSNCGLCSHKNLITGKSLTLKTGQKITPNAKISCSSLNVVYCIVCPGCKEFYIGETKCLRKRMNLHRSQSSPTFIMPPPLKVNQHIKQCTKGYFQVFPFFSVRQSHQIAREGWEAHFQKIYRPTLH